MKISTTLFLDRAASQIGNIQGSLSKTQEQLSTGKEIVRPSDAPDKAAVVTRLESALSKHDNYKSALNMVKTRLGFEETSLTSVSDALARVKELATQAGNDTLGAQDRKSIAMELKSLRDQILSYANTQDTNGHYIFAGGRGDTPAFGDNGKGQVDYVGDQSRTQVIVGDNRRLNANRPGSDVFNRVVRDDGKGGKVGAGFFQVLDDLTKAVEGSNSAGMKRGLNEIDQLNLGVTNGLAQVGADGGVVDAQTNVLEALSLQMKTTLSETQDLDYTTAITKMNRDQLALEAAQSSFAKISKLSLFNYLG
jgi:flagellar hook-associated protein 3 FlgL